MSTESKICVISTHILTSISHTTTRINLTPWDLQLLNLEYIQKGLLFRNPEDATCLIHHLRQSLTRTLTYFPPLSGQLVSEGGSAVSFFIDCNNAGALFIHATMQEDSNLTVADILDPTSYVLEVVQSFFPLNGVCNYEGVSKPLLAVQVTELKDGLFIGCSINHSVLDGTSFWHFFNSWAETSRGHDLISKLPILNRDRVTLDLTGSNNIKIDNNHLVHDDIHHMANPTLKDRVFCFTRKSILRLKTRANQEMDETSNGKISSLQAIIAHIWRSIIRCRFAENSNIGKETTFEIPMGARQRITPPLPNEYFGNAIFPGVVTVETGKILANGMGWIAWQINKMVVAGNGPDQVKEFYMNWTKKPEFLNFAGMPKNRFILISSPRFDAYGNDFGWGKPVGVRSGGANRFDGRITVSSGLEEGSIEIEACLSEETLCALGEDEEFMEFVH